MTTPGTTTAPFSVDTFAKEIKDAMNTASPNDVTKRQAAAASYYRSVLSSHTITEIMSVLQNSIPPDANVGEMIIHTSDDLTILYARLPPRFMSAIHDHTIFACIGALIGREQNIIYSLGDGGKDVPPTVEREFVLEPGQIAELSPDVIHSISNPSDDTSHSLHIYGGDFKAVMNERTLWSSDELRAMPFSFPALMKESCLRMKKEDNDVGLDATATAVPALKPLIEQIRGGGDDN